MCRNAHDRPSAVVGEDVVRDPDGYALAIERVHRELASRNSVLLNRADVTGFACCLLLLQHLVDLRSERCIGCCKELRHWMLRSKLY